MLVRSGNRTLLVMPLYTIAETTHLLTLETSVICYNNPRIDRKVRKNDTYESVQEYQFCQHYEGNNLQQVA